MKSKKVLALLLIVVIFTSMVNFTPTARAPTINWLDTTYKKRRAHTVNQTADAGVDYPVNVTIHYGSGSNTNYDLYLDGECQSNFGDLAFSASDMVTPLAWWPEQNYTGKWIKIWVKIPGNLSEAPYIYYLYYNSSTASEDGDGMKVFSLFDDFNDGSLNMTTWDEVQALGTVSEAGGVLTIDGPADANNEVIASDEKVSWKTALMFNATFDATMPHVNSRSMGGYSTQQFLDGGTHKNEMFTKESTEICTQKAGDGITEGEDTQAFTKGSEAHFQIRRTGAANVTYFDEDNSQFASINRDCVDSRYIYFRGRYSGRVIVNWVAVRKYQTTEPSQGAWGEEEDLYYVYNFHVEGFYFENGTKAAGDYFTVVLSNGTTWDYYVDGNTSNVMTNSSIERIQWDIDFGGYSSIRSVDYVAGENYTLFVPDDDFNYYTFTIRDYTGRLGTGTAYLEAWEVVNGTQYLIERKEIITTLNEESLNLVEGNVYTIRVRFGDDSTEDFGIRTMTDDTTITLPILSLSFSQRARSTYKYVTVEARRPIYTTITLSYNDTRLETNWANVTVEHLNGTKVASGNYSTDSFTYTYVSAIHNVTYKVRVEFDHGEFGLLPDFVTFLEGNVTYSDTPDIGAAGTVGDMDTTDLLGMIIIAVVIGAGTYRNSEAVLIAAALIAAMFSATGFVSFDVTLIEVVIGIVLIYNLVRSAQ